MTTSKLARPKGPQKGKNGLPSPMSKEAFLAKLRAAPASKRPGRSPLHTAKPRVGDKMRDGTIYAGISPDTGKAMYTMPADALTMTFNEAQKYAKDLDAHGHTDWRVPTKDELNVLFNNHAAIGGFNVTGSIPAGWYWSASENDNWFAWGQRFRRRSGQHR